MLRLGTQELLTSPIRPVISRSFIDNDGVPPGILGLPGVRTTWMAWGLPDVVPERVKGPHR